MIEEDPLTARWKRKLRREFKRLGRGGVRDKLHSGGYGVASRADLARQWLREQEEAGDRLARLTLDAAVIAAAIGVILLLVMLGIIK